VRWLALLALMLLSGPAAAQAPLPGGQADAARPAVDEPSPNDIKELSRLLTDPAIIAWLQARAAAEPGTAAPPTESLEEQVEAGLRVVSSRLAQVSDALTALPETPGVVAEAWNEKLPGNRRLLLLNLLIVFVFAGAGLEWLYWRYADAGRRWIERRPASNFWTASAVTAGRLALQAGGFGFFALGAIGSFIIFEWPAEARALVLELLIVLVEARLVIGLASFVLAPHADRWRLVPLDRKTAKLCFSGSILLVVAWLGGAALADTSLLLGASQAAGLGIDIATGLLMLLLAVALLWMLVRCIAARSLVAIVGTIVLIALFGLWLIGADRIAMTLAILALMIPVMTMSRQSIERAFGARTLASTDRAGEPGEVDEDASLPEPDIYQPVALRLARFVIVVGALLSIGLVWGAQPWQLSSAGTASAQIVRILIDIAVAVLIGDLIWTATRTAIDRRMASMPKLVHGRAPGPEARMATLLPLFKKVVMVTLVVMVGLIALSSLGINIGPILAGAGVVGLAIGFGAQALVRDIVSGVFFLIDDAFRVGEYIEMGELRGTVESISIRSLRVRHHRGAVHTIPFGELKSLTNYSRDWVMMKLEFRVPFETDLALAKKIVKKIDAELRANPDYGNNFLEPLKFQGVRRMEEFNMVVGVKFMTKPGDQWTIRRDAYQRIRDEFDKAGIHFAQRNVKVEVIGSGEVSEDVKRRAVGAAQDAIDEQFGAPAAAAR